MTNSEIAQLWVVHHKITDVADRSIARLEVVAIHGLGASR